MRLWHCVPLLALHCLDGMVTDTPIATRTIGSLTVPVVGLGCNNFGGRLDYAASLKVIDAAIEAGVTFFDTADVYGDTLSEEFIGNALKDRRDQVVLATKFGHSSPSISGGARPEYVRKAVTDSLTRLQTDHIDLYQLHRPDPDTPIEETVGALQELADEGLVIEYGCSNFDDQLLDAAHEKRQGGSGFVSVQNQYSLLHREPEQGVLDACERLGVGFIPFFPLHSGILTGKYRKGVELPTGTRVTGNPRWEDQLTADMLDRLERLIGFSESRGHQLIDLAFSWLLSRSQVKSVIAGATKPEQVRRNAAAASWELSTAELDEVDAILGTSAS